MKHEVILTSYSCDEVRKAYATNDEQFAEHFRGLISAHKWEEIYLEVKNDTEDMYIDECVILADSDERLIQFIKTGL